MLRVTSPRARPKALRSKTRRTSSNERVHAAAHCAPAYSPDIPVPAPAPEPGAPTADRLPRAFASRALRADALRCIPGESHPAPLAAGAGWPPAAGRLLLSGCGASVHACHSAPHARRRCAPPPPPPWPPHRGPVGGGPPPVAPGPPPPQSRFMSPRPPPHARLPQLQPLLFDLLRRLVAMPLRGMALRQQPPEAGRTVPPQRPIPGLARDVVALAELRHRFLTGLVLQDKPQLFLHDTARFPWHRRSFLEAPAIHSQCQESSRSNLSAISPVRTHGDPPPHPGGFSRKSAETIEKKRVEF